MTGVGSGDDAAFSVVVPRPSVVTTAKCPSSDAEVASAVPKDKTALGIVTRRVAGAARDILLSDDDLSPVQPTDFSIATEESPLTRQSLMYGSPNGRGLARRFIDYTAHDQGDVSGTAGASQSIAQRRLEPVGTALGKVGLTAGKAVAFGAEMRVADSTTPEGRKRNWRVEVYLAP